MTHGIVARKCPKCGNLFYLWLANGDRYEKTNRRLSEEDRGRVFMVADDNELCRECEIEQWPGR